jgi:hypothetical protein
MAAPKAEDLGNRQEWEDMIPKATEFSEQRLEGDEPIDCRSPPGDGGNAEV